MPTEHERKDHRTRRSSDHPTKFPTRRERHQSSLGVTDATHNPVSVADTASTAPSMISSYPNSPYLMNSSPTSAASSSSSPRRTVTSEFRFTRTTPQSTVDNQKKNAARTAARRMKTSRLSAESNSNQTNHVTSFSPGAFSVPGTNWGGSPRNEDLENRSESINSGLDRPLSLVIAAQLVDHVERDEVPDEDLELRIKHEVESRLMERDQNLVVAEVVPPPTNPIHTDTLSDQEASCKQLCWKWKYLVFFLLLSIGGAITGVSIWAISVDDPPPLFTDSPTQGPTLAPTLDPRQTSIVETIESNVNTIYFEDPTSAQSRARDWLLYNDTNSLVQNVSVPPLVVLERFVLAVLFYSTNGTSTTENTSWTNQLKFLSEWDVCDWNDGSTVVDSQVWDTFGVYCQESEVTHIRLSQNGLGGTIPSELSLLTRLQVLGLESNTIGETIPTELGRFTALQKLFLHTNRLDGNLPSELGQLKAMSDLQLHTNNMITTFPTEMGNLTGLIWFDLYNNRIYGTLPTEVGQLTSVQRFHLYDNDMTGQLPTELGNMISMTSFRVYSNDFTGTLPTEMAQLTNLQQLYVHSNVLTPYYAEDFFKANNPNLDLSYSPQSTAPGRRGLF